MKIERKIGVQTKFKDLMNGVLFRVVKDKEGKIYMKIEPTKAWCFNVDDSAHITDIGCEVEILIGKLVIE